MTPLFEGTASSHAVLLALASTIFLAWLAAFAAGRLARRALQTLLGDHLSTASPLVRGPLRLVSLTTFVLCTSLMLFPAFELAGLKPRAGVPLKTVAEWAFGRGLKIVLIGVLAYALVRTTALMVQIKLRIKTVPQRQHEVGRELRKRIRRAFDQNNVAVPFPERLVAVREGAEPR